MNKQIIVANKIITYGDLKRNWDLHQQKVKNAKATLTTRAQSTQNLKPTLKTARVPFNNTLNRMMDIDLQNKALLKKLTQKNKQKNSTNSLTFNHQYKLVKNNRKKYYEQYERHLQNQGLLKRIKQSKPQYIMHKFMQDRKVQQKYINSISKYGYKNLKPNKTIIKFQMENDQRKYSNSRQKQMTLSKVILPQTASIPQRVRKTDQSVMRENKTSQGKKNNQQNQQNKQNHYQSRFQNSLNKSQKSNHSNCPSLSPSNQIIVSQITERRVKIGTKIYQLKGVQKIKKISLQILDLRSKRKANEYVHQVQIGRTVWQKRFQSNWDQLIKSIRFNEEQQQFFLI